MLKTLDIENIAIIEKLSVSFSEGFNVLTGETGAGKSIIIDSINAVTGEKTSKELIRTGEAHAFVSAFFEDISDGIKTVLADNGIPCEEDGTLLLSRRLSRDGKTACRINGCTVTAAMLKNVGSELINIHGQKDSQALLNPDRHIDFLDAFGGYSAALDDYRADFIKLRELQRKLKALETDESEKARKIDLLSYQINEIEQADVKIGEKEELHRKKELFKDSVAIASAVENALSLLRGTSDEDGAASLISLAGREILAVGKKVEEVGNICDMIEDVGSKTEEICDLLLTISNRLASDDMNIEEINDRLDILSRLSRKYGSTEEEILAFLENAKAELDEINFSDELFEKTTSEFNELVPVVLEKADKISEMRKNTALNLSAVIEKELAFLKMPGCRFVVGIKDCTLCSRGKDSITFNISANPGEEPKPLNKIASGGELSRIMLAMKTVLAKYDTVGTLIFDEIDTGVSGAVTGKIGQKLAELSEHTQILCITHQAQLASFASDHKFLYKQVIDGKTYTCMKNLSEDDRADELARMTYGENADETQVLSAKNLIESHRKTADNE